MKYLLLLIPVLLACNSSEPPECTYYDTINVEKPYPVFDSLAKAKIDSMVNYWNDNLDARKDSLNDYALKLDSLKNTLVYDNLIIKGTDIHNVIAEFDTATGKPILRIN